MFNHKSPKQQLGTLYTNTITTLQTVNEVLNKNYGITMFAPRPSNRNNLNNELIREQTEQTMKNITRATTSTFFTNTARIITPLELSDSTSETCKD